MAGSVNSQRFQPTRAICLSSRPQGLRMQRSDCSFPGSGCDNHQYSLFPPKEVRPRWVAGNIPRWHTRPVVTHSNTNLGWCRVELMKGEVCGTIQQSTMLSVTYSGWLGKTMTLYSCPCAMNQAQPIHSGSLMIFFATKTAENSQNHFQFLTPTCNNALIWHLAQQLWDLNNQNTLHC